MEQLRGTREQGGAVLKKHHQLSQGDRADKILFFLL